MRVRVDWRASCSVVGSICKILTLPLAAPLVLALYDGTDVVPFLVAIVVAGALGVGMERLSVERQVRSREAFLLVALAWLLVAVIGAIPLYLAGTGQFADPVDALFESMSGITTTGATVITDFDAHSRPVLLWRQVIQWLGGLGILIVATALLSRLGVGGAQLMETETQTRNVTKLTPHIEHTARLIWTLYIGLTALAAATYYALHVAGLAPEMTAFDAVAHALTSVSTSGFSPRAESVGAFSPAVQWAVVPFMAVGATSFVLIYSVVGGDLNRIRRSEEFRFYLGLLVAISAVMVGLLAVDARFDGTAEETLRHGVFQTVSIVTTTGYASTDFELWSAPAKQILLLCMFIGGMSGSTTCSIKTVRWLVVVKAFRRDLFVAASPNAVRPVRLSGDVVDEDVIRDVYAYTLVALVCFVLASVFVVIDSARAGNAVTELEALSVAASMFFNIGPAFGKAGPYGSYEWLPRSTKLVLTLVMWVGRIEIIPILVMLRASFWTGS
ncbi:TrkH family potassium uptake protein [Haloarchaeobius litoreus]|uniref:TrkH family potassium uptake protein n=1 Tax=Haloarchaeobius litoreus TaxID=755306 RepID=A0ABD6DGS9_9EURY|nr:TrkH family potassium uptake protein [Haloarchaeobius litoreus]